MNQICMKSIAIYFAILSIAFSSEWLDMQMGKMDRVASLPKDEQIEVLGDIVTVGRNDGLREEQKLVFRRSQAMLISIPGHAEYYRQKMEDGMAWVKSQPNGERALLAGAFGPKQSEIFQVLELMPSPEAVKVLGEYLSDERGWDPEKGHPIPTDGEDLMHMQIKNCDKAVRSLARMIENPPEAENVHPRFSLPTWRLWYNQVKAGNRTFRFKGDPTEYDLNGPASATKTPDAKRSDRRAIADSSVESKKESGSKAPTITAIIVALLIGGYWIHRARQKA